MRKGKECLAFLERKERRGYQEEERSHGKSTQGTHCRSQQLFLLVYDELLGISKCINHFPELSKFWISRNFLSWKNESLINLALQALGIMFRLISVVQTDPRPYANGFEWSHRLELIILNEIELIALLFEDGEEVAKTRGTVSIVNISTSNGVLARDESSADA
ncbi:hypothetical protein NE237_018348 [Protea cynaroides]|uniref:Nematode resistance protein-like HSPRO1 N-terminal domain-containing protein n=1 Tax=Protea cynaroides TaxID=273540 RepID=A0A9Q0K9S0_9MAGN|nr:hypothetical protein NE237_018348 [Protea cynaroides]